MKQLALLSAALLASCFVSPQDDMAMLALEVGVPLPLSEPMGILVRADHAWDPQDRFHLARFPRFIRAAVEVDDYELATGSWPTHPASEAQSRAIESSPEIPLIELPVPAGPMRHISAVAYDRQADGVTFYESRVPAVINLLPGKAQGAELEMVPAKTGAAAIALRCQDSVYRPYLTAQISVVDARAQVVLPPRPLEGSAPSFDLLQWEGLPLDRPFRMQVLLEDALSQGFRLLELIAPTFTLTDANETHTVKVKIPCGP